MPDRPAACSRSTSSSGPVSGAIKPGAQKRRQVAEVDATGHGRLAELPLAGGDPPGSSRQITWPGWVLDGPLTVRPGVEFLVVGARPSRAGVLVQVLAAQREPGA